MVEGQHGEWFGLKQSCKMAVGRWEMEWIELGELESLDPLSFLQSFLQLSQLPPW